MQEVIDAPSGSAAYDLEPAIGIVVCPDGRRVRITPLQMRLMVALHAHKGRPIRTRHIAESVFGWGKSEDTVRMAVKALRREIAPDVIDTRFCFGYGVGLD